MSPRLAIPPIALDATEPCPACGSHGTRSVTSRQFRGRSWTLARCDLCGQHFTSPVPSDADIASFYAGDYHAPLREAGGSERAFGTKYDRYLKTLSRFAPRGRALDIGCATGLLVKRLIDHGYDALGIELNSRSAEYGQQTYGIDIRNRPVEACAFEPHSFDAIFLTDVLEHTRSPLDFLGEVRRILKPRGCAMISFPDICSIESCYLKTLAALLHREWIWNTCHIPLHTWEFTHSTATALFESAGFEVVAFSRSQPCSESQPSRWLTLLHAPLRLLSLPIARTTLGTQLEFVIRKPR